MEAIFAPPKPRGNAEQALAAAAVRHEAEYYVPIEHHNPMELYASTVIFEDDGKLTVYDKTQGVQNVQQYLCNIFKMKPDELRVLGPFMGGGFGSGLRPQYQAVLAVLAARKLRRSVRVVLTRPQMYEIGYRPAMIQRIALGANAGGTLDATIRRLSSAGDWLVGTPLQMRQRKIRAQAGSARPRHFMRYARAQRPHRDVRA
jgi:xanthine dehydrogenase YagR molybdenum-binding subunit